MRHDARRRDSGHDRVAAVVAEGPTSTRGRSEAQMTDPSRYDDDGGIPRWVKVFGIVALVVALLVVVLFFAAPLPLRVSVPAVGLWAAIVVLGAVLATEAAATRAARLTVREALTYL